MVNFNDHFNDLALFNEEMVKNLKDNNPILRSLALCLATKGFSEEFRVVIREIKIDIERGSLLHEAMKPEIFGDRYVSAVKARETRDGDY